MKSELLNHIENDHEIHLILDYKLVKEIGKSDIILKMFGYLGEEDDIAIILYMKKENGEIIQSSPSFEKTYKKKNTLIELGTLSYKKDEDNIEKSFKLIHNGTIIEDLLDVQIINIDGDLFSRVKGIFKTNLIAQKKIVIFGVGSGGSIVAVQLAKSGVNNFALFDFDRLEVHNVSRHACGLKDLGRLKTDAVADILKDTNPNVIIEKYNYDILEDQHEEDIRRVVEESDVIVMATDSEKSRYFINRLALQTNTTTFYAGASDQAKGGEILRIIPGKTACYGCLIETLGRLSQAMIDKEKVDYTVDPSTATASTAVPGLSVDVSMIGMLQAKVILMHLIHQVKPEYPVIEEDLLIWSNTVYEPYFPKALVLSKISIKPHKNCMVCGGTGTLQNVESEYFIDLDSIGEL